MECRVVCAYLVCSSPPPAEYLQQQLHDTIYINISININTKTNKKYPSKMM